MHIKVPLRYEFYAETRYLDVSSCRLWKLERSGIGKLLEEGHVFHSATKWDSSSAKQSDRTKLISQVRSTR